jgi:hypothetical protein
VGKIARPKVRRFRGPLTGRRRSISRKLVTPTLGYGYQAIDTLNKFQALPLDSLDRESVDAQTGVGELSLD